MVLNISFIQPIAFSIPSILPGSRNDISEQQQKNQLSALVEFILERRNFLTFFWICGCGADIANCLEGSLEFWKSNAKEGLEVGAQILVWRLLKELFLFQWKTPHLTAERTSWEVLGLRSRIGGHCRGDTSDIGSFSGKEGEFSYCLLFWGDQGIHWIMDRASVVQVGEKALGSLYSWYSITWAIL